MMSQTNKWRSCNEVCRKIRKSTQFRWERETANFREKNRPSTTVKFESSLLDSFSAQSWIRKQVIIYKPLFHLTCTRYNRWQEEKLIRVLLYLLKHKRALSNLKLSFYLIFQDNTSCIFVNIFVSSMMIYCSSCIDFWTWNRASWSIVLPRRRIHTPSSDNESSQWWISQLWERNINRKILGKIINRNA